MPESVSVPVPTPSPPTNFDLLGTKLTAGTLARKLLSAYTSATAPERMAALDACLSARLQELCDEHESGEA